MRPIYITFDRYYNVETYNSFLQASKNNGIELEEYIRIRAPFTRFIKLKSKRDLPSFVNYDFATSTDINWMVSVVKPVQPNEAYLLKRREGKDDTYWDYIIPKELTNAHKEEYIIVFSAQGFTEVSEISKKLGSTKIFKWGRAKEKNYKIYYCFNPYIKGLIATRNVLMEYGKEAKLSNAINHNVNVPNIRGDLEYNLNHFVLVKEKLEDKTYEAEYWENGKIFPLKRETFL